MILGEKSRFAIEWLIDETNTDSRYNFGSICLWIADRQIGELQETVILSMPWSGFQGFLQFQGQRCEPSLESRDGEDVLRIVVEALDGGEHDRDWEEISALSRRYHRFCLLPAIGCEAFDGEWVVLIECADYERVICKQYGTNEIFEIRLETGEAETVMRTFVENETKNQFN